MCVCVDVQAKETLAEIPGQFLAFMKKSGISPNPPPLKARRQSEYGHGQAGNDNASVKMQAGGLRGCVKQSLE